MKGEFAGEETVRKGKHIGRPPKRPKIDYKGEEEIGGEREKIGRNNMGKKEEEEDGRGERKLI